MKNPTRPASGLILAESRTFVAEAFALDVDGALPVSVREHYPCHDIPLAPEGTLLAPWSARDAAAWMSNWPPNDGELYAPIDVWDEEIAALWLQRHQIIEELNAPELTSFKGRRSPHTALEVLSELDDDSLLVLTDAFLCERYRREVMPAFLTARAEAIRMLAHRVGTGDMLLRVARKSLRQHDEKRDTLLSAAFAECDDWIGEWIIDLTQAIIDMHVWPVGFSVAALARFSESSDAV